jgi:hypothetical protein
MMRANTLETFRANCMVDPDLLLVPELLNMQSIIPTCGKFIRFSNGLQIRRKTADNPIALKDKAAAEAERLALIQAMMDKMSKAN